MATRIILAEDHEILRDGLRLMLTRMHDGFDVVGEASDGREAVRLAEELAPDVVVMDITMQGLNGIEATRQILQARPEAKVLGLSGHSDHRYISEMLKAGALGYITKCAAFDELADAIRAVAGGRRYLDSKGAEAVFDDYVRRLSCKPESTPSRTELSGREREVLQLIAEGRSTKEIAAALHISVKTVETHRLQVMRKLDIHTVAGLTRYALREGITSLED